jgi:FkbM family methyltransferase
MNIKEIAYKIRHSKLLEKQENLWSILRKPYHFFIDPFNNGVKLNLTTDFFIRIPASFYKSDYANYEIESVLKIHEWVKNNSDSVAIDIGTAWGYFSSIILHSSSNSIVYGIDSDIVSVKVSKWVCSYVKNSKARFYPINCLISDTSDESITVDKAIKITEEKLNNLSNSINPSDTKYVNLGTSEASQIPIYSIDKLFRDLNVETKIIIKCDIEGAEILALKGANSFIKKHKPVLLLSVHPDLILNYNSTKENVANILNELNYNVEILAIDHEEHWWCESK